MGGQKNQYAACSMSAKKPSTPPPQQHIVLTIWSAKANNIKEASIARRNIFRATPTVLLVFVRFIRSDIYERPHHHTIWLVTDTYIVFCIAVYTHTHVHTHTHTLTDSLIICDLLPSSQIHYSGMLYMCGRPFDFSGAAVRRDTDISHYCEEHIHTVALW